MAEYQDTPEDRKPKKARTDKEILEEARERLKLCIDDYAEERKKQKDDLLFSTLEQWPSNIRSERENDPNGSRPCLTIDQINQYIVQVVNDMRQNRPAVKARPVDDQADIETAEVFQGIIRQIEDQSVAQVAYATAGESAVRVGEGYFRFVTEYEDDKSFNQVIRIKRCPDMFCVYLGHHVMPDGSDTDYGFIFEDMLLEKFKKLYPKAKYHNTDFSELEKGQEFWAEEGKIRVAEYFYFDYEPAELVFTADGQSLLRSEYDRGYEKSEEKPEITDTRTTQTRSVKWCKLTGIEILEKRDWAGKYIPIVKVIGKESWVDGKRVSWGLVRPAKDSLRMYNYWASTITERIALSPQAPFIGAVGQFATGADRWQNANRVKYAFLEYDAIDVNGTVVPPPQRQQPAQIEVAMIQQLQIIREDVQASLGMFKAALGREQPNQSGKAILALTRESDTGTFHFSDNQSIAIQHGGRIMIDLIPKIYDTKRIIKILGEDGKLSSAAIDPEQPVAKRQIADASGKVAKIYNLNVGTYDVTATVGPSYNTKRMEAATLFTDLGNTAKDPISGTIMRYLAVKNSDVPGAEQAAEMLEKLLPPGLIKQEGQPQVDPQTAQAMQQMKQIIQMQGQKMQELESGAAVEKMKIEAKSTADQASVQSGHDTKMKELALQKVSDDEEMRIKKERSDQEIAIKWAVANCDADIAQKKCVDENKQAEAKMAFEQKCREQDEAHKASVEVAPQVVEMLNTSFGEALEGLQKTLDAQIQATKELTEATKSNKHIAITMPDGRKASADVAPTLN